MQQGIFPKQWPVAFTVHLPVSHPEQKILYFIMLNFRLFRMHAANFFFAKSLQLLVITQIIETLAIVCGSIKFSFVEGS